MKPIRHTGLLVVLVALFVSLSLPGYPLPPAEEDPQAFEAARKKFLDVRDADGMSALHNAVIQNKPEYVRYLIEMGADLEAKDPKFKMTPLCFAVYLGNLEMSEFLINSGADINAGYQYGHTPLHLSASRWAAHHVHNIPTIFCMSLNPGQNNLKTPTSTGVSMSAHPKDQLRAFKQAIPGLRSIGIVYDPRRTEEFVLEAGMAAGKMGLRLVHRQVSGNREASRAMSDVAKHADALWLIRDATVLTRETFEEAVDIQTRHKIPLLTYSEEFVAAGAFASYSAGYHEQGELAAQMAKQIEEGALPRDIPVQHPQGGLMINLDVAEQLSSKFKVPPEVLFSGDVRKYKKSWGLEKDLTIEKRRMR